MAQEKSVNVTNTGSLETQQRVNASEELGGGRTPEKMDHVPTVAQTQDETIVDWQGPQDPENPLHWSTMRKVVMIGNISFITFLSPLASTIVAPASSMVMEEFDTANQTIGSFVTSVYLLGYAFGPLILAPLSELYGRSIVYNSCNVIFLVFNIACAEAPNMASLIVFRLFAGLAGSCPLTLGAASIADMMALEHRGKAMAGWVLGPLIGPVIGPIIGGYLSQAAGWRWIFWLLTIASGVVCLVTVVSMKESSAYTILERKTKRLCKDSGNLKLKSKLDSGKTPAEMFAFSIVRPIKMLILSPIVLLLSTYAATVYGYMYLCFTTFPGIFEQQYGFSSGSSGLSYLGIGVGSFVGLAIAGATSDRTVKSMAAKNGGTPKPEYRLPLLVVGALLVPGGLFWYGWSAEAKAHYIVPIIGTSPLGIGIVMVVMATTTYLVDAYTVYSASAVAASTVLRSLFGALLPLAGPAMYSSLGVGWGTSVLGFIAVAMIPVPFVFIFYGERIRNNNLFKVEW